VPHSCRCFLRQGGDLSLMTMESSKLDSERNQIRRRVISLSAPEAAAGPLLAAASAARCCAHRGTPRIVPSLKEGATVVPMLPHDTRSKSYSSASTGSPLSCRPVSWSRDKQCKANSSPNVPTSPSSSSHDMTYNPHLSLMSPDARHRPRSSQPGEGEEEQEGNWPESRIISRESLPSRHSMNA
jgi:hypothetical protein